ncbi:MAG TPA: hypothetical protein VK665_17225, partial [Candidatus Elarobacter sp.]|nr:hypothetical protein [Candidatus Elarobacter sp.]
MAGIDALAAAAAIDANLAAQIDAELAQLAADAQALRGLLVDEMVVTARVLPSNGLTDLVEIAGRRVAASLPPTVRPGDVLQVQVSGFDGDRIVLQIVATGADAAIESPATPGVPAPADVPVAVPRGQPGSAFSSAVSRANVGSAGIAAPSRSVSAGNAGAPFAASSASAPPLRQSVSPPPAPTSIEARVAAARAAGAPTAGDGVAPERSAVARTPGVPQPFVAPPYIAAKPAASSNGAQANSESRASQLASHAVAGRGSQLAAYAEPVALLRALRLPVTPSNVASARLALESPQRLPETLAALERALPQASGDPNVATLRTLLAFVGRIDPRSPALAAQIAAYVDHVV